MFSSVREELGVKIYLTIAVCSLLLLLMLLLLFLLLSVLCFLCCSVLVKKKLGSEWDMARDDECETTPSLLEP